MFLLECDESTPKDNKDYNPILEKGIETIHPTIFREMSGFLGYLEIFCFEKSPQPTGHPDPPGSPSTPTPPTQRFNICEPWPLTTSSGIAPPKRKKSTKRKEDDKREDMACNMTP